MGIRLYFISHYNELSKIWILSQLQIYNSSSSEKHNTSIKVYLICSMLVLPI